MGSKTPVYAPWATETLSQGTSFTAARVNASGQFGSEVRPQDLVSEVTAGGRSAIDFGICTDGFGTSKLTSLLETVQTFIFI